LRSPKAVNPRYERSFRDRVPASRGDLHQEHLLTAGCPHLGEPRKYELAQLNDCEALLEQKFFGAPVERIRNRSARRCSSLSFAISMAATLTSTQVIRHPRALRHRYLRDAREAGPF
jgi:hypothetical protein